jgi:protein-S-isoprenylcysteine O-methyltransferase Ste14
MSKIVKYPLVLTAVLLFAQLLFGRFAGFSTALGRNTGMAALILLVMGVALILAAGAHFRLNQTTVNPTLAPNRLITKGLFRFSRNPMYLGMLLLLMVQPLLTLRPQLFVFTALFFIIMNFWVIPREEIMIKKTFGHQYDAYCTRTKRWANLGFAVTLLLLGCAVPVIIGLSLYETELF